jgi:hypothetical protein
MIIVGGYDDEKCNRQRRKAEQAALAPGFRTMAGRDRQQFTHGLCPEAGYQFGIPDKMPQMAL